MKTIFFVTVLHEKGFRKRCWGWYADFAEAQQAVFANHTDIFEAGWYNLAVIEEIPEGVMAVECNSWWYRATFTEGQEDPFVERLGGQPKIFDGICCFSLG